MPDFNWQFILMFDESTRGIAHISSQKDSFGRKRAINYGGHALHASETK
jgi:hypothetical protein